MNNLLQEGLAAQQQGDLVTAKARYEALLQQAPNEADALHLLGLVCHQLDDHTRALTLLRQAIARRPSPVYLNNLALVYNRTGQTEKALQTLSTALKHDPNFAEAYYNQGSIEQTLGKTEQAIASYRAAVRCDPRLTKAYNNLGNTLRVAGELEAALGALETALSLEPNSADTFNNKGSVLNDLGDIEAAKQCYTHALELNPNEPLTYYNLGTLEKDQGHFQEAKTFLEQALSKAPNHPESNNNLGLVYKELGLYDEALALISRAITLKPDYAEAHNSRGILALLLGDYDTGWQEYHWRFDHIEAPARFDLAGVPEWQGESLTDETLFVYGEQGIGDEIMLATIFPELESLAKACVISCDARLVELFSRSFPTLTFTDRLQLKIPTDLVPQKQVALFDCLGFLRKKEDEFPKQIQTLQVDTQKQTRWQYQLDALGPGKKIGLSFTGGKDSLSAGKRSIDLAAWSACINTPNTHFINLQYGDHHETIDAFNQTATRPLTVLEQSDPLTDMDDFAALISCLDLVISVDNSTVHLSGMLGVPTWVCLPAIPEWRWLTEGDQSHWYPSLNLCRQKQAGQWSDVLAEIAQKLSDLP